MKKITSKTSYSVIFALLLVGTVSVAYAATITLGATTTIITGDLDMTGTSATDDDTIFFDDGTTKFLKWDESESEFDFSSSLGVGGDLVVDGAFFDSSDSSGSSGQVLSSTGSGTQWVSSSGGGGSSFANDVTIGTASSSDDDSIFFDDGTEFVSWDNSDDLFRFSNSLIVGDHLEVNNGGGSPVNYNRMGTGTTSHGIGASVGNSLLVSGDLETNGNTYLDNQLTVADDTTVGGMLSVSEHSEFSSTVTIRGKLNASGGVDPPYVSFTAETHESIRQYAQDVLEKEEVMFFWNTESKMFEVYHIAEDTFYTLDGQIIQE